MNNKFFKVLFYNVIFIFIVFLFSEFICAFIAFNHDKNDKHNFLYKVKKTIKLSKIQYSTVNKLNYNERIRKININTAYNKSTILLLGCSYTYGDGLKDNETFSYLLSNYTKRNVINLGMCCASPREMLYMLQNENIRNDLIPKNIQNNIDYVIYTYISDQKRRLYADVCFFNYVPYYYFDKKSKKLKYKLQNKFIRNSFLINFIKNLYFYKIANKNKNASILLNAYFLEIKNQLKNNPKFVILVYEDYNNENWDILKNEGIDVIDVKNIADVNLTYREYKTETYHPNKKAWEIIVPKLAKRLNL